MDFGVGLEELEIFNMWETQLDQWEHIRGKVESCEIEFLNFTLKGSRTTDKILIHGVTGQEEQNLGKSLLVAIGNKSIRGRFVLVEDSSACLLGRDLLQTLDVELHLSPEGIDLIIMGMSVMSGTSNSKLKIPEV